ncbi:nucleoid-associated protein [Niabella beijingensis]|uniref:nucleoid-associated protein n=1 Tax=Niabella beijingensis TaxID=2872700 RepID=UPI001CC132F1|nr:nucleoid-associated protein [Niabella beijingensis]MBZ4191720.1 nucleoid-associated protein [Niabella beijingensis]
MTINEIQIFKINLEEEQVEFIDSTTYGNELVEYLKELFGTIIAGSSGRQFLFERETTEVRAQISRINRGEDFVDIAKIIADRLMSVEFDAQQRMIKLGILIQKGILVQAKIEEDGQNKFIICKADHNEFLNEIDYSLSRGLPVKKKAFKAFVCNLYPEDTISDILVYDTNPSDTKYWWKDLLELSMVYSDEDNTERAFAAIDKSVFAKIKKEYPQDYTYLRNSAVRYFRSKNRFEMQDFLDNVVGDYEPCDAGLRVDDLKVKIRDLPTKQRSPFDSQFNIIRDKIKAKFLNTVKLTPEIDLHIKGDFADNTILAEEGLDGQKYVKIKSDEGYRYFKSQQQ